MNTEAVLRLVADTIAELRKPATGAGQLADIEHKIEAIVGLIEALHAPVAAEHAAATQPAEPLPEATGA